MHSLTVRDAVVSLVLGAGLWPVVVDGQTSGQWSGVQNWPIVSVHTHLLPTGKVMFYPYGDDPRLWDPGNNSITTLPRAGYNIFCTGHSFISDGRLLVTGGHVQTVGA